MRPVTTSWSPIDAALFPYDGLQSLTKRFLGRRKSQVETDRRLLDLIRSHGCAEVAFAACASYLSTDAVREFLDTNFGSDAGGSYLQAFVAAAHLKSLDFEPRDRTFATILVAVATDTAAMRGTTLQMLISAWRAGPPTDQTLHSRALALTETVFENARSKLDALFRTSSWHASIEYRASLLQLDDVFKTAGAVFEGIVNACFPTWPRWVAWRPDKRRIDALTRSPLARRLFSPLQELEGPDVVNGDGSQPTVWQGLIQREKLIPWLESNGFQIGVGLIVGDTKPLLTEFMQQFLRDVVLAMEDGAGSTGLLKLLLEREGLDASSLTAWENARDPLLKAHPRFSAYIISPTTRLNDSNVDSFVVPALATLAAPVCRTFRTLISSETARCIEFACQQLSVGFRYRPSLRDEWLLPALRLWRIRQATADAIWLHPAVEKRLLETSKRQPPARNLHTLKELYVRVTMEGEDYLPLAFDAYIYNYVLDPAVSADQKSSPAEAIGQTQTPVLKAADQKTAYHRRCGPALSSQIPRVLHNLWTEVHDEATREVAITLATLDGVSVDIRHACIAATASVTGSAAEQLQDRLLQIKARVASAFIDLTDVVVSLTGLLDSEVCWAALLWSLLQREEFCIDQSAFTERGSKVYMQWIRQLHFLFGGKLSHLRATYLWHRALEGLEPALEAFEVQDGTRHVTHQLLTTTQPGRCKSYLKILIRIKDESRKDRRNFMLMLLVSLRRGNAGSIYLTAHAVLALQDMDFQRCEHFLPLARQSKKLASAKVAVWLNMPQFSQAVKAAFTRISECLDLQESHESWAAAKKHYDTRVQDLIARARKLETTRMALMRTARMDVERLLSDLELECPAGVSALVAELPSELIDVVEDVAEDQLEMHFNLSGVNSISQLALGVQGTETIVVTLRILGGGMVDAFCVHLEESVGAPTTSHKWISMEDWKAPPTQSRCKGKQTRLTHVVTRAVWRELQGGECDVQKLKKLYTRVRGTIQNNANQCIVCATDIGARLHRATSCGSMLCDLTAHQMDFEVRAEMVRHDSRVVDLLLTAVYAVATIGNLDLLPGRPSSLQDAARLLRILNALPATKVLATAADMEMSLRQAGKHADLLVSWLCNASRIFIISASGHWRIPNMPGIHQFLVVDNPPEIEAAFAKHNHVQPRMVLFHGTSMDRLYAILAQGLRVLSNTPLMKHGAASGAGIYFSTDTALPASYAGASAASAAGAPAFFQPRKDFDGPQVLLGCEHAGPANTGGVHVVTDPTRVVVRYVFLVPRGVAFPLAKDIAGPMISTFHSLRSSAAVSR